MLGGCRFAYVGCQWPAVLALLLLGMPGNAAAGPDLRLNDRFLPVPAEEYPVYDRVVASKFLTSQTELVLIDRLTATRLAPQEVEDTPPITVRTFQEGGFFDGALPPGLIHDFVLKNQHLFRVERRFDFGVRYRLVSDDGSEMPEVSVQTVPAAFRPTQAPTQVGRLAFSRVGFTTVRPDGHQALVYVSDHRSDGTGAGFLIWLRCVDQGWDPIDTEVLWTIGSRPGQEE